MAVNVVKIFGSKSHKPKAKMGLGDMLERTIHPFAKAMKLPCLNEEKTELRPESPCAKRRDKANELGKKVGIGT